MKKKNITDQEKLDTIFKWAVAAQRKFILEKEELVTVSKAEMVGRFEEVIQLTKEVLL